MVIYDTDSKLYKIHNCKELYYLLTGLSYTNIGIEFYGRHKYKFTYKIRKIMKLLNVTNRRELAYIAVKQNLVSLDKLKDYKND